MNVNTKEGSAWLKGKALEGEEQKKPLERAYGAWVNDTYWLLMPYKLRDPGVILRLRRRGEGGGGALRQGPAHVRQRRPDAEGQVLGVRQPRRSWSTAGTTC